MNIKCHYYIYYEYLQGSNNTVIAYIVGNIKKTSNLVNVHFICVCVRVNCNLLSRENDLLQSSSYLHFFAASALICSIMLA